MRDASALLCRIFHPGAAPVSGAAVPSAPPVAVWKTMGQESCFNGSMAMESPTHVDKTLTGFLMPKDRNLL